MQILLSVRGGLAVLHVPVVVILTGLPVDNNAVGLFGSGIGKHVTLIILGHIVLGVQLAFLHQICQRFPLSDGTKQNVAVGLGNEPVNNGNLQGCGQAVLSLDAVFDHKVFIVEIDGQGKIQSQSAQILDSQILVGNHAGLPQNALKQSRSVLNAVAGAVHNINIQIAGLDDVVGAGHTVGEPCEGGAKHHAEAEHQCQHAAEQRLFCVFAVHCFSSCM